jgi:hypothetical protein
MRKTGWRRCVQEEIDILVTNFMAYKSAVGLYVKYHFYCADLYEV